MKKALLAAASVALLGAQAFAQMPDNSICPDWTGTDLNGRSHNLYSYLDSGYTVFIDVSATWCGPCWSYHNTHALANLYNQYGPGTAENKVRVFFIEGQQGNTTDQILGISNPSNACQMTSQPSVYYSGCTQGNWTTGTPYPIIDDASIGNLLQISFFPTIYKVCPNRVITLVGQKTTAQLWATVGSCQAAVEGNDATLLPAMGSIRGCAGSPVALTARLQNLGSQPLTSATIEAKQGSTVLGSTNWTGDLPRYGVANVNVASFTPTGNVSVTLNITTPDANLNNNSTAQSVQASTVISATNVTFQLQTDNYGSETSWKLFNSSGSVVHQGGPYTNGAGQPLNSYNWTLNDMECYRLEVYDAYGDGFCCSYGNGYYKLISNGNAIIQGGQFADVDVKMFKTNNAIAGISDNELNRTLAVYPNPTSGAVNIEYSVEQGPGVKASVLDLVGKVVLEKTLRSGTAQRETLDLGNLANGMYVLKLDAGQYQAARTITVNK